MRVGGKQLPLLVLWGVQGTLEIELIEQWIDFIEEVEVTGMIELAESTVSTGVGR